MILLKLFYEFFIIGTFSVGGGLATLPYLYDLADKYDWFTRTELIDMIAISESTPGPLGVNMATFAGFNTAGILGGVIATMGLVVPALIIILSICKILDKFKGNKNVNAAFYGIRPTVAALILCSAWDVIESTLFHAENFGTNLDILNIPAILTFIFIYYILAKYKKHPAFYIALAALLGVFITF